MRKPIIGGNWKMNLGVPSEAVEMLQILRPMVKKIEQVDIIVAPPFTVFESVINISKKSNIKVAAQNMYFKENGAFTGEISPNFLKKMGVEYVILGHSERRNIFNETDELINKKLKKALSMVNIFIKEKKEKQKRLLLIRWKTHLKISQRKKLSKQ